MQIQMETCGLEECDFVETRFKEYGTEEEFWVDITKGQGEKGVVLYFVRRDCAPVPPLYRFNPMNLVLEKEELDNWIESVKEEVTKDWILYETKYWYLNEYSCVLVRRNKPWFNAVVPKIKDVWTTILKERIDGYEHRAPKKKIIKESEIITELEDSKIVTIVQNNPIPIVKLG
jgi:hypothetical protein